MFDFLQQTLNTAGSLRFALAQAGHDLGCDVPERFGLR
jgi:hypothetical protein